MAETEIDAEAQPPEEADAERLALDLSPEAVSLYTRIGRGWAQVASAPFEGDGFNDFNDRLAALRERAIAFARAPGPVALWLPDEQIWLAEATLSGPEAALPGQALAHFRQDLGRKDAELAVAVSPSGDEGTYALAATEASTWREARDYCERWGFTPGRVSTRLAEEAFGPSGPDLQPVQQRAAPLAAAMPGRGKGLHWAAAGVAVAALGLGALWWQSMEIGPPDVSTANPAPLSFSLGPGDGAARPPAMADFANVPAESKPPLAPPPPADPKHKAAPAAVALPVQPVPARPPGEISTPLAALPDAQLPAAETALAPPAQTAPPAPLGVRKDPAPLATATPWVPGQISELLTEAMTPSTGRIHDLGAVAALAPVSLPAARALPEDATRSGAKVSLHQPEAPSRPQPMPRTAPDMEAFAERIRREFAGDLAAAGSEPHVTRRVRRLQKWSRAGLDLGFDPPSVDPTPLLETSPIPDLAPPEELGPLPFGGVALALDVEPEDLRIGAWQRAPVSRRPPPEPATAPEPASAPSEASPSEAAPPEAATPETPPPETAALTPPAEAAVPDAPIPDAPIPDAPSAPEPTAPAAPAPDEATPAAQPDPAATPAPSVIPPARPGPEPAEAAPDPEPVIADVPIPRPRPTREVAAVPEEVPDTAAPEPPDTAQPVAPDQIAPEIDPAEEPPSKFASLQAPKPPARPKNLARRYAAAPNPATPIISFRPASKNVRRSATQSGLPLGKASLIGVLEIDSRRIALLRLPSGRFKRVGLGQVLDGWKVSAIGKTAMRLTKQGQNRTLLLVDP